MIRRASLVLALAACSTTSPPADGGPSDAGNDAQSGVAAIFATSCALATCHAGPSPAMKLDLSPDAYVSNLVGVPAAEMFDELRVAPGAAFDTQSYLLCKIDPECAVVGDHMPIGSALPSDQIAAIRAWVASLPPSDASAPVFGLDSVPPTFGGASAATPGPSSITLSWSAATDDVTPASEIVYLVYEASAAGAEDFSTPTLVTPPGATTFAVGKLAPTTTRWFVVRARDHAGNIDGNAIEVSATTPSTTDTTPPTFAGATSATSQSPGTIAVSWSAATDDFSAASQISYAVYVAKASGGESFGTPDVLTLAGKTSALVSDVGAGTKYWVVVRAIDQAGNFDSNAIEVTAQTPNIGFTNDVWPIFQSTCTSAGCHVGTHPAEGLDLSTATSAHGGLVNVPSGECGTLAVVTPSSPSQSYLLQKLRGWGSCFVGAQMPEQSAPLTNAQIDLVSAWIGKGAPLD